MSTPPVWLFMSGWTANNAPTHQRMQCRESASNVRGVSCVAFKYFIVRISFFQVSTSGLFTRVLRKATLVWMSGLALLQRKMSLAMLW
eukprot:746820-Ditylum_brightwellii.AAC.1